jgi:hypothetical protein
MKTTGILKIIGLLPVGLILLVYLAFGIGEAAGGDIGGLMHLVQFVLVGLAIWLCWRRPLWGGILLLAIGLFRILVLIPELFLRPADSTWNISLVVLILIPVISGGLFLSAGLLERKTTSTSSA